MKSVEVYCCGEIISCNEFINECENCGAKYDLEGDRIYEHELRELDEDNPTHVVTIVE